ncbi:hypothetical protein BDM02DRAFT_3103337, partial [Thelephora ganbajun]
RSRFYERYRAVAEEHDKEFMRKYDEDLNTTLIFVGLSFAVASAFVIQVDVQLQPDHNEETTALLRVLIYKMDNTTFGGDVPTIPQWSGPPRVIIQIQVILCASLSAGASSLPAHGTTTTQEGEENSVRRSQKKLPMQSSNNLK